MRSTFTDTKEDNLVIVDKLEEDMTNLAMQIEFSEEISEQEFRNIEKYIDKVVADIQELRDNINFSN